MPKANATFKLHITLSNGKTIAYTKSASFNDPDALTEALIERIEDAADSSPPA